MLKSLSVKDFAIVEQIDLDFSAGMTVFTGETGAGKSILLNALGLCFGDKADSDMIREGASRAESSLLIELGDTPEALHWLKEQALDDGQECLIRRVLDRDRRAKAFVNGSPVAVKQLQQLGDLLIDIHGQHAHQSLLRPRQQQQLLDAYGQHQELADSVERHHRDLARMRSRLRQLQTSSSSQTERIDLLRFQIDELQSARIAAGEFAELEAEQQRLGNLDRILQLFGALSERLYIGERCVQDQLAACGEDFAELQQLDPVHQEAIDLVNSALIQVEEVADWLRSRQDMEIGDANDLRQVEERLGLLHDLARKHRCEPDQLPEQLLRMQQELQSLDNLDQEITDLLEQLQQQEDSYRKLAEQLSRARHRAGGELASLVTRTIRQLGMGNGQFQVQLTPLASDAGSAQGLENVAFLFTANPGQPLQPLNKVASGGELSRLSLAIQVATASLNGVPTLVYDEVDVGIGGAVAETVGRLLQQLAGDRQIFCITHLAQVAAFGDRHFQVRKEVDANRTTTQINGLPEADRVEELARMIGGESITATTLAHAREMLETARGKKQGR